MKHVVMCGVHFVYVQKVHVFNTACEIETKLLVKKDNI